MLANDIAAGTDPTLDVSTNDVAARFGIILDTRDNEVAAEKGVKIEGLVSKASADVAGDVSYTRWTLTARGHLPVTPRWGFAGRIVAQAIDGTPGVGSLYAIEGEGETALGLGGGGSHRGILDQRLIGRDMLFGNLETRYALYAIPTVVRVTAIAFLDAGRVFHADRLRLTTSDLKVGGGTGLFVHLGAWAIAGMTGGIGPDGAAFDFHTQWTF